MKPDFKNRPLTAEEFEKMPQEIAGGENYEPVYSGKRDGFEIDVSDSWSNPIKTTLIDTIKLIGFIGDRTGIRLSPECGELLQTDVKPH